MLSLAASALVWAPLAQAQTAAPAPAPAASDAAASAPAARKAAQAEEGPQTLKSVIVTANRRREPARDVPMQVNAVPAEQLQKAGARSLQDYMADLPGVDVKSTGGAGLGSITIRGVSTGNQTIATVGTYVDDVAVGSTNAYANGASSALDMSLLDLKRIELLRGPQGTLYGAGAMGGVLKYVTNEPDTYEFTGQASLGISSTKRGALSHVESAILNVPLKEDVAGLRVAAFTDRTGGWIDAIGPAEGRHVNGGRTNGARVSLLIAPDSRWKVRLTDTYQDLKRDGTETVEYDAVTGQPLNGVGIRNLSRREPYALRLNVAAADIEYDFGWARLNSITSVQNSRYDTLTDFTQAYGPLLQGAGLDVESVGFRNLVTVKKTTQEFRLTSKAGERFEWLLGAFWNREEATNDNLLDSVVTGGAPGPDIVSGQLPSTFRELAAYGDITWNLNKEASITAGMRIARNKQRFSEVGTSLFSGDVDTASTSEETSRTYLLTGKYSLTPTSNVYVRVASGYRPGGPNLTVQPTDPSSFNHDSLWSYEAGYKADLLDKSLSVEASLFKIRWNDLQQNFSRNGLNVVVNSGKADIKGAELAVKWQATRQFSLAGNLALIDSKLTEPAEGLGAAGSRLPNSARVAATLAGRYTFDLASRPTYVGVSERFIGKRNAGFEGSDTLPNYVLPSYAVTDLQAGVDLTEKTQLAFFVRNATNKVGQVSADTGLLSLGGPLMVNEERPRTVGLTLTVNY
jgi:outer membrane receptor protein involved in Fe transport